MRCLRKLQLSKKLFDQASFLGAWAVKGDRLGRRLDRVAHSFGEQQIGWVPDRAGDPSGTRGVDGVVPEKVGIFAHHE